MGEKSQIEWTDATWNPVTGCTHVSEGCRNCYAERIVPRQRQKFSEIVLHPERLEQPLHWKKPRKIFVNSLSDLFHEEVPDEFIENVWARMMVADRHVYQILTKRPKRMYDFLTTQDWERVGRLVVNIEPFAAKRALDRRDAGLKMHQHIWLGVSIENKKTYRERVLYLANTPAAVRFLSIEPLLDDVGDLMLDGIFEGAYHWVIVGGESGPKARSMRPDWVRSIRDQCQAAQVPFFFKQGSSGNWTEYKNFSSFPEDLQIREFPQTKGVIS